MVCNERPPPALLLEGHTLPKLRNSSATLCGISLPRALKTDDVRDDVASEELASYWHHALTAATSLPSKRPAGSSASPLLGCAPDLNLSCDAGTKEFHGA